MDLGHYLKFIHAWCRAAQCQGNGVDQADFQLCRTNFSSVVISVFIVLLGDLSTMLMTEYD